MEEYSRAVLKVVVAQICQTIGWHSVNTTPLEFMIDLLQEYIQQVCQFSHQFAEVLGRTDVNLDDVGLTFQLMNINSSELSEYVKNVESVPCVLGIPKLPIFNNNHLNYLNPGSKEIMTKSAHMQEYFPSMYVDNKGIPVAENDRLMQDDHAQFNRPRFIGSDDNPIDSLFVQLPTDSVFKRPSDPSNENVNISRRNKMIDDSRPLREIHSVIMTTSGLLSPAREGKLPESRTPIQARNHSPPLNSESIVPDLKSEKKIKKSVKKGTDDNKIDKENKKKNRDKESTKSDNVPDKKVSKRNAGLKEPTKHEALKQVTALPVIADSLSSTEFHAVQCNTSKDDVVPKLPKSLSPKRKNINFLLDSSRDMDCTIDKLPVEPDKQKINILKKISKPREEKLADHFESNKIKNLHEIHSDSLNTDVDKNIQEKNYEEGDTNAPQTPDVNVFGDIELVEFQSPSSDVYIFDDISSPGTPSTPKTPEMNVPGIAEQKKKRKEKSGRKRENMKHLSFRENCKQSKLANEVMSTEFLERPKTPEAVEKFDCQRDLNAPSVIPFPFFSSFPPTPGLIPHPINHPMFQRFPLPAGRGLSTIPPINPNIPLRPPCSTLNEKVDNAIIPKSKSCKSESFLMSSKLKNEPVEEPLKVNVDKPVPMSDNNLVRSKTSTEGSAHENNLFLFDVSTPSLTNVNMKLDRVEKKSKKHKIEKKDKFKKKKDRKEKHKEKIKEKIKEKKEKLDKLKDKKERKERKKEKDKQSKTVDVLPKITFKLGNSSKLSSSESSLMKKITIKPLPKKLEEVTKRESSPELAKISALITRPPKQKFCKVKPEQTAKKTDGKDEKDPVDKASDVIPTVVDQGGHQVWICPACGNQDDGSPMIGCDDCDAWYHWVCVGMQVPPATNEDWYCCLCIAKKQELHNDRKKRKRRKKMKIAP